MEINENAPGNISQCPSTRTTDNETGFDHLGDRHPDSVPAGKAPTPTPAPELPASPLIDQNNVKPLPDDVV